MPFGKHKSKNMHPMNGHKPKMYPKDGHPMNMYAKNHHPQNRKKGESLTEYRDRLSGPGKDGGKFSKKLIEEYKASQIKKKEEEFQKEKDHVAKIKAEVTGNPNKYPQSNKFIGELTKAKKAGKKSFNVNGKSYPVTGSGASKYVMNIGGQERFNDSPFNLRAQQLMNYAPANKGADGYKPLMPDYSMIKPDTGSEENGDDNGNENENKPEPSKGTKRLSEARQRRREARKNLKAQRLERRSKRMEARLKRKEGR